MHVESKVSLTWKLLVVNDPWVNFWTDHCNNFFPWHQDLKLQSPLKIIIIFPSILTTSIRMLE